MLIAQELIHTMAIKKGKHDLMTLNLDMEKAYDRLEWKFLKIMLLNFDFPLTFVHWILQCVTTSSATILLNSSSSSKTFPQRRLRQGTQFSLTSLFFVAKYFPDYFVRRNKKRKSKVSRSLGQAPTSLILLSWMICFCVVKPLERRR